MSQKVVTTAIVVVPPKEVWPQIQSIRQQYDKSFVRWPPHINLIYPFVPAGEFPEAAAKIKQQFTNASLSPFRVTFANFSFFQHGKKSCTVWCDPQVQQGNELKDLQNNLEKVFPFCDDLSTRSEHGFQPHLSVGQFQGKAESEGKINEFMRTWKPFTFEVTEVFLISRKGDDPFQFKYRVPFEGDVEPMDLPYEAIPGQPKPSGAPTRDVFVGNLPFAVRDQDLLELFTREGVKVLSVKIPREGGRAKGYAFVKCDASEDIQLVIAKMDKKIVQGREIAVKLPK